MYKQIRSIPAWATHYAPEAAMANTENKTSGTNSAMEEVLSLLRKKVIGPHNGSCVCNRPHRASGQIEDVIPPKDPGDLRYWFLWKVRFVPNDGSPSSMKPLSGFMERDELTEVLRPFRVS